MSPSGFHIFVHIAEMLGKPFFQALTSLANVLFSTSGYPTADGIAQVGGGAVNLSGKVNPIVGGSGTEG